MKWIYSIILALIASAVTAEFPVHTNICTSDVVRITGGWNSFRWDWISYDSQTNTITIHQNSVAIDLSGGRAQIKIGDYAVTGLIAAVTITNATISNSNVIWSVAYTNMPAPKAYLCECYYIDAVATNYTRTLWQGKINITDSLYRE